MKRMINLLLLFAITLGMLNGCSSSGKDVADQAPETGTNDKATTQDSKPAPQAESKTDAEKPVTLNLYYWDELFKEPVDAIVKDFTAENPNIKVSTNTIPFGQYWTKLQTTLTSASGPDVFWLNYMYSLDFAPKGLLAEVEDGAIDLAKFPQNTLDMFTYEDKLYCVPFMVDTIAMIYNKPLFDEAGVPYPTNDWTWNDLKENAKKLTVKDNAGNTTQFGCIVDTGSQSGIFCYLLQNDVSVYEADMATPNFNSPAGVETFQYMLDLMYVDGSAPTAAQIQEVGKDDRFMAGQAAMAYAVTPRLASYRDALGDIIDVVELPKGKKEANTLNSVGFAGSANSANPEAVKKFLAFSGTQQAQEHIALSALPAYEGGSAQWLAQFEGINAQCYIDILSDAVPLPLTRKNAGNTRKIIETETANILMKEKTIEQGLSDATDAILAEVK